jgi:hypothetical protein
MFWKNLPYWLKGGIIFVFVVILLFLLALFVQGVLFNSIPVFVFLIFMPGYILTKFVTLGKCYFYFMSPPPPNCPLDKIPGSEMLLVIILNFIFYFFTGAILSLIHKKLKTPAFILAILVIIGITSIFVLKIFGFKVF